jgi:ArsR family transcriptional regulator, arsenate/arsenite/antimonite-responsive transcriptional repressor
MLVSRGMPPKKTKADAVFRAFSDLTRLRIMVLISKGEVCVGDLVNILKVPQPTASRHLAYLRRSGLVQTRKAGQWIYYGMAPAKSKFQKALFKCLECCFDEVPEIETDALRARKLSKKGGCC